MSEVAKYGGFYVPVSSELLADGLGESFHRLYAEQLRLSMDRMLAGLCTTRHSNGDWCTFATFHGGTHVTAEGRWIARRPEPEDDYCECCGSLL